VNQPEQPVLSYEVKVDTGERLEKFLKKAHGGGYDLLAINKLGTQRLLIALDRE